MFPTTGSVICGRYTLASPLGEGAFGAVYAAADMNVDRRVAVKLLKPDEGAEFSARLIKRFEREVRMVAALRAPSTVKLFDYGRTEAGVPFLVFELVPGEDLAALLARRGRLSPPEVAHIARQLLSSLSEAHGAGLLHRDIKPDNIRVFDYMGDPLTVKLIDFGLARPADGSHPSLTATGELTGSPRYMAPEQLAKAELTKTSDLYALGIVLYELLVGAAGLPEVSLGQQLARAHKGTLLDYEQLARVAPDIAPIVERMTAPEPPNRFASAEAVLRALTDARPTQAMPHPGIAPAARPQPAPAPESTKPRLPWGWIAAVFAAASLGVVGTLAMVDTGSQIASAPARGLPNALLQQDAPAALPADKQPVEAPRPEAKPAPEARPPANPGECRRPFVGQGSIEQVGFALQPEVWPAYIPEGLPEGPAPMLLLIHQSGHTGSEFLETGGFIEVADKHGFVLVAPSDPGSLGDDSWDGPTEHESFVLRARDAALERLCIDPERIYLVGHGSGAVMADHLMCMGWSAGFASHALAKERFRKYCAPPGSVPYFMMYPKDSGYEPYKGGDSTTGINRESIDEAEARWIERNRCGKKTRVLSENGSECYRWECETPFESCHVKGGHGWPNTRVRDRAFAVWNGDGPEPDPDFPMAMIIGDFLAKVDATRRPEPLSPE